MRVVSRFIGVNREFRGWLAARLYPGKVVSLAEYRRTRKNRSKRAALRKMSNPSIA